MRNFRRGNFRRRELSSWEFSPPGIFAAGNFRRGNFRRRDFSPLGIFAAGNFRRGNLEQRLIPTATEDKSRDPYNGYWINNSAIYIYMTPPRWEMSVEIRPRSEEINLPSLGGREIYHVLG